MNAPTRPCLGLALSSELASQLERHLPRTRVLENRSLSSAQKYMSEKTQGGLVFIAVSTWKELAPDDKERLIAHKSWQFMLIADQYEPDALEYMSSGTFLTLMTCPLDRAKISRALEQAEEVSNMYEDIFPHGTRNQPRTRASDP